MNKVWLDYDFCEGKHNLCVGSQAVFMKANSTLDIPVY